MRIVKTISKLIPIFLALSLVVCNTYGQATDNSQAGYQDVTHNKPAKAVINLDGSAVRQTFEGLGAIPSYEKLLYDYPEPQRSEILDYMFKPNFGAALQVLKVEIGYDGNNTAISWASYKRSSDEKPNFNRGYSWWLMKEAKKRNPDIKLSALHWGYPAWAKTDEQKAKFIFGFVKGAKEKHGLHIDYIGGNKNEQYKKVLGKNYRQPFINTNVTIKLRQLLDANGYDSVNIVAADEGAHVEKYDVLSKMNGNAAYKNAVDIIGLHYKGRPSDFLPASAYDLDKPIWSTEDGGGSYKYKRSGYRWVDQIIRLLQEIKMNGIIRWSATASIYDNMPWPNNGFIKAKEPWSGHYKIGANLWAFSHFTQFTEPGWKILDTPSRIIYSDSTTTKAGRYIAFKDNKSGNYTIVINTNDQHFPESGLDMKINLGHGLSQTPVHLWRSNFMKPSEWFKKTAILHPEEGKIQVHLDKGRVYTLSTTTGQNHGTAASPPEKKFPYPFKENFESYHTGSLAPYFVDANGKFVVSEAGGGRNGKALQQVVKEAPTMWHKRPLKQPLTEVGDMNWTDYKIEVDVLLENAGKVLVSGRFDGEKENNGKYLLEGYWFSLDHNGKWKLMRKDPPANANDRGDTGKFVTLSSGRTSGVALNHWIPISLAFEDDVISAFVDKRKVAEVTDDTFNSGNIALGTISSDSKDFFRASNKWTKARFDNLEVTPVQ